MNLQEIHVNEIQPRATWKFKNCLHMCVYHCAQLSYTIQRRTVMVIFSHNLQTIVITQMLSVGGERWLRVKWSLKCVCVCVVQAQI